MNVVRPQIAVLCAALDDALSCVAIGPSPPLKLCVTPDGLHCKRLSVVEALVKVRGGDPFVEAILKQIALMIDGRTAFVSLFLTLTRLLGSELTRANSEYPKIQLCIVRSLFHVRSAITQCAFPQSAVYDGNMERLWQNFFATRVSLSQSQQFVRQLTSWLSNSTATPQQCAEFVRSNEESILWTSSSLPSGAVAATLRRRVQFTAGSGAVLLVNWKHEESDSRCERLASRKERRESQFRLFESFSSHIDPSQSTLVLFNGQLPDVFSQCTTDSIVFCEVVECVDNLSLQLYGTPSNVLVVDGVGVRHSPLPTKNHTTFAVLGDIISLTTEFHPFISTLVIPRPAVGKTLTCEYVPLLKQAVSLLLLTSEGVVEDRSLFFRDAAFIVRSTLGDVPFAQTIAESLEMCGEQFSGLTGCEFVVLLRGIIVEAVTLSVTFFRCELEW